jgi:hypothetical protein
MIISCTSTSRKRRLLAGELEAAKRSRRACTGTSCAASTIVTSMKLLRK